MVVGCKGGDERGGVKKNVELREGFLGLKCSEKDGLMDKTLT